MFLNEKREFSAGCTKGRSDGLRIRVGRAAEKDNPPMVRVEPKTIGIAGVMHNHYTTKPTPFEWHTDPFIWIASGQAYPYPNL